MIATLPRDSRTDQLVADRIDSSLAEQSMRVSRFDLVSSLFAALIWFFGVLVSVMFVLWCLAKVTAMEKLPPPQKMDVFGASAAGGDPEFEEPEGPEIEQLTEPDLVEVIAQVDLASTKLGGQPPAGLVNQGTPGGLGPDQTPPGSPDGDDIVPRWERWQLVFKSKNEKDYAIQLDHYQIELGVFGGGENGIHNVSDFSFKPISKLNDKPATEKRLYFSWQKATPLAGFERNLISRAGVNFSGKNIVKFIPMELENQLAIMELEYARKKGYDSIQQIAKTVFESQAVNGGYKFTVIKQRYRK